MKSKTHKMVEEITKVLGPIFHANSDYNTIQEAIALVVARVAQSTPNVGNEEEELEVIMEIAANALNQFINEEKSIKEKKFKLIQKGIEGFSEMVSLNGDDGPAFGLAAVNGGMSPEASDEATDWVDKNVNEEATWDYAHPEAEQENTGVGPDGDPGYHPDGHREYAP